MTRRRLLLVLVLLGGLAAYGLHNVYAADKPNAAAMPSGPMPVPVQTLQPQAVHLWQSFPGRLSAIETVAIRPRVGGTIQAIYFKAGDHVKKGAKLFLIDPRPYQAIVNRAAADLNAARTEAALTTTQLARAERLLKDNAIARREYDERINAERVAQSKIAAAQAALEQAQLNVQFATITAPVDGKISRAEITVGNVVDLNANNVLATLVSQDPIFAEFDVDERTYVAAVKDIAGGVERLPVEMTLGSDAAKIYQGHMQSFDNQINPASGTIRARAIFDNKDDVLVPGMFATVRLSSATEQEVLLVGEDHIGVDQSKRFVLTVNDDNKIVYNEVTLGASFDGKRVIEKGLVPGLRIVMGGLAKLRPDMVVAPQEIQPQAPAQDVTP